MDQKKQKMLEQALPHQAVKPHPTKSNLSTIKAIFVTERLNEVFGMGGWRTEHEVVMWEPFTQKTKNGERPMFRATVEVRMYVDGFEGYFSSYGGSDNDDLGDALKGAVSDAITKIAAVHFHVGLQVYKGEGNTDRPEQISEEDLIEMQDIVESIDTLEGLREVYAKHGGRGKEIASIITARSNELKKANNGN